MKRPHRLILASAGTGKTYQLTGRYLALLLKGVPPERILATTFTRKAAGEILDRVLKRLAEAASDEAERKSLELQLADDLGGRSLTSEELTRLLADIVRALDSFRIQTLDAFFVHVGHLFALDLGLPADWDILEEVEDEALRRDAVGRALRASRRDTWIPLLRALQRAEISKSIERLLLETVRIGRDSYLDSEEPAWHFVCPPAAPSAEELAGAGAAIEGMQLPLTQKGTAKKHWVKSRDDLMACVATESWKDVVDVGLVKKLLEDESHFDRHEITEEHREAIEPVLRQAGHVLLMEIERQNEASYTWLERFEEAYRELKREERGYRFEDLPQFLAPAGGDPLDERRLDMWYRLDGRVDHLLLDEFQDTAPIQWRILERLAGEILADGTGERTFFCVGDVKQSIYGWREAEPRLLAGMPRRYEVLADPEELTQSHRSGRIVLETVNGVFEDVAGNAALAKPSHARAAAEWSQGFQQHEAAKDLPSAALMLEAPRPAEGEKSHVPALGLAAVRAAELAAQAPQATIGILLRKNDHISRTIYLLRQEGLRASGEGGNPLTDSAAVLRVVSLFHLADHPDDSAAAFHVETSVFGAAFGLAGRDRGARRENARRASSRVRERIAAEGYGAFCASLRPLVREAYGEWDLKRFEQLVDLAFSFERRAACRTDPFVDAVRSTAVEDPASTHVKVMTIHAAKGLEFDAVILPELDEPLHRKHTLVRARRAPEDRLHAVSNATNHLVAAFDPEHLGVLQEDQEQREVREAISLLYVAMTRAKHRLEMIVGRPARSGSVHKTFAGILRAGLGSGLPDDEGVLWAHHENAERWFIEPGPEGPDAEAAEAGRARIELAPPRTPRSLPRHVPSAQEGGGTVSVADVLRSPRAGARQRGALLHRWFQEVEWLPDFERSDEELRELAQVLEPERDVRSRHLAEFRRLLAQPGVRAALTRPDDDLEYVVWSERPFACILPDSEGHESFWSGVFDRVVLGRRAGRVVAASILDYKTDAVDGAALDSRAEHYRPQLEAYRHVLAHMTGLEESDVRAGLLFLAADDLRWL